MKRTDTRMMFRPLCTDLVGLLRTLSPEDWEKPTIAGSWRVRDVLAHLVDTALRRLSFHRDGHTPPAPDTPLGGDRDFVAFINGLNASWIDATRRLSPRVLTDVYERATRDLCDFVEGLPDDTPAAFPVSWTGDRESPGWLDIGREFTEVWHHGAQIREAVGAGPFGEPRWLRAVLEIAVRALPHAYREVRGLEGASLLLEISGPSGGSWTLRQVHDRWTLDDRGVSRADAVVGMSDQAAWRLFFNALAPREIEAAVRVEGDRALAGPLLRTRSVIV